MANKKNGNWQKGKQGFQKTTPKTEEPRSRRSTPAPPDGLVGGISHNFYVPHRTIKSTLREYSRLIKDSFRSKGWKQRARHHAEQTARLGIK